MDDIFSVQLGEHTYQFRKLNEGQLLALILSNSLGGGHTIDAAGRVAAEVSADGEWPQFIRRMASGEHTPDHLAKLVDVFVNGGEKSGE